MSEHLTKKDYFKIMILMLVFIILREIFADWEHFKQGLFGLSSF